ncbi:MAG: TIGR00730 family Rossman fold protein, partial [Hydrogenophaga sp.]|nr:TIGR00730 family Rossman fold protein [Hydrogenophaga sp.]
KRLMAEHADAFLALPGGIGTFEEFFEVWTWRQLGYHDKPVGLLNVDGYYDGLLSFLRSSVQAQFMGEWQMDLMRVGADLETLLPDLVQAAGMAPASRLDEL